MIAGGLSAFPGPRWSPAPLGGSRIAPRRLRRLLAAGCSLMAAVLAVVTTGCGASGPAWDASATVRSRVAAIVLEALDAHGVPVAFDSIQCHRPALSSELICLGNTADEPAKGITARFMPTAPTQPSAGSGPARLCPGTLTIGLDTGQVVREEADPCR